MRDDQGAQVSDILLLGAQVSEGAHFEEAWLSNEYNFHRGHFLVQTSLWNAPGFQSSALVSKFQVCVVGIVLMMCIILCCKVRLKLAVFHLCSKVILLP